MNILFNWKNGNDDNKFTERFDPANPFDDENRVEVITRDGNKVIYNFPISEYLIDAKLIDQISKLATEESADLTFITNSKPKNPTQENFEGSDIEYITIDRENSKEYIIRLLLSYDQVPDYIYRAKAIITLLYEIRIQKPVNERILANLNKYVNSVINFLESKNPKEFSLDNIENYKEYTDLIRVLSTIDGYVNNHYSNSIFTEEERRSNEKTTLHRRKMKIRQQLARIPKALGKDYDERYWLLRLIKLRYNQNDLKINHILQILLDLNKFEKERNILTDNIKKNVEDVFTFLLTTEDYTKSSDDSFKRKCAKLDEYMKKNTRSAFIKNSRNYDGRIQVIIDYFANARRCVGFMKLSGGGGYFSLSGLKDYQGKKSLFAPMSKEFNHYVVEYLKRVHFPFYDYAPLVDNVTCYGTLDNTTQKLSSFPIPVILKDDSNYKKNQKEYACCERKMLAALQNDKKSGDIVVFSRWSPCPRCIPALKSHKGNVRNYYYTNDIDRYIRKEYKDIPGLIKKKKSKKKANYVENLVAATRNSDHR